VALRPDFSSPPIKALAMLPPPMNTTRWGFMQPV
jgi:hypothetical protein